MDVPHRLAPLVLALAACTPADGAGAPGGEAALALFSERCAGCHVAPDPAFAVERAWLGQVLDTA